MKDFKLEMLSSTVTNYISLIHNSTLANHNFQGGIEKKEGGGGGGGGWRGAIISHDKYCLIDGKVVQIYEFQTHYDFYEIFGIWTVTGQANKDGLWVFKEPEFLSDNEWNELFISQDGNSLVDMIEFASMDEAYQFCIDNK